MGNICISLQQYVLKIQIWYYNIWNTFCFLVRTALSKDWTNMSIKHRVPYDM